MRSNGNKALVGRALFIKDLNERVSHSGFTIRARITSSEALPIYVAFLFQMSETKKQLLDASGGSNISNLSQEMLSGLSFPLPPPAEQQRIAAILTKWDEAIEKLQALIARKKDRKKALMQQLLTGQRRFKEFEGQQWETVKLGEVTRIGTGNKDNQNKVENGQYPFFVRSDKIERIDSYSFEGEAILIPGEGRIGEIIHYINGRFDFHQRVYKISNFDPSVMGLFCFYYLQEFFGKEALKDSVKATVDSLRLPTFINMPIPLPPLPEQRRIAAVLSAADAEIEGHTNELKALRKQKQGLMQSLLTGKISVKNKAQFRFQVGD